MPATANVEVWPLVRSRRQQVWNLAFIVITSAMLWPLLHVAEWAAVLLIWGSLFIWSQRRTWKHAQIRFAKGTWWLDVTGSAPVSLEWRTGSVRRKNVIIWQYGKWPWQRLIIRPDSLPEGEYQRLVKALY